jgi:hypothetical protein
MTSFFRVITIATPTAAAVTTWPTLEPALALALALPQTMPPLTSSWERFISQQP